MRDIEIVKLTRRVSDLEAQVEALQRLHESRELRERLAERPQPSAGEPAGCCTSCGELLRSGTDSGWSCATCLRDVCDGCARENEHGEVVCPEHAP